MALLDVRNLTMRFGGLTAIDNLDLQVQQGEIFSLIGPNGAGKTTVFNAVTGIYQPTAGTIKVAGRGTSRSYSWKMWLAWLVLGLLTGLAAVLVIVGPDGLVKASIKQLMTADERFSYVDALE